MTSRHQLEPVSSKDVALRLASFVQDGIAARCFSYRTLVDVWTVSIVPIAVLFRSKGIPSDQHRNRFEKLGDCVICGYRGCQRSHLQKGAICIPGGRRLVLLGVSSPTTSHHRVRDRSSRHLARSTTVLQGKGDGWTTITMKIVNQRARKQSN